MAIHHHKGDVVSTPLSPKKCFPPLQANDSEVLANDHTSGSISENLWWVGYWTS
jgi:hypothetical protein